ncbi:MAG: hypothetical protein LBJ83_00630 [Oscillospiraceae bacterium]|nr:hypothetical protein [Oscillospiraceae bacterium]
MTGVAQTKIDPMRQVRQNYVAQENGRVNLRVVEGSPKNTFLSLRLYAAMFALTLVVIGAIFSRVQLTEITEKMGRDAKKLEILESDELILRTKLEDKVSAVNVEERAMALGMEKLRKYQVEYVNVPFDGKDEINASKLNAK